MRKSLSGGTVAQQPEQVPARRSKIVPPEQADARLATMGLSVDKIHRAVIAGDDARGRVSSPYYPRNFAGITMWAETLAGLRRQLLKLRRGWRIGSTGNYETAYSSERQLAFAVVSGDSYTGIDGARDPKLTRRRGPKTKERVRRNAVFGQLALDLELPRALDGLPADEACSTWFLVLHPEDDMVRVELSLPVQVGDDGLVGDWIERILIPPVPVTGAVAPIERNEDDDDGEDPMVTRPA
ncbi:hypothetical protein [Kitasatospora sp. MBT63]|uniref:hypothetical protein n=1 Tax=Kitasatospora sp. MBT63 TaxID=1444768 RepID=UPI0011EA676C|nr:hypothetical protein [Kitasatospora sp. MBT63]